MAKQWFPENIPRTQGELEQFYLWTINKLRGTGANLDELDQRSLNPLIGTAQEIARKLDSLQRDTRNIKAEIEQLKRKPESQRSIQAQIARLEHRISQIEGEL